MKPNEFVLYCHALFMVKDLENVRSSFISQFSHQSQHIR